MALIMTGSIEAIKKSDPRRKGEDVPLVEVRGLGVKYNVGAKRDDFQSMAFNKLRGKRGLKKQKFWGLRDVSFTGHAGDVLGVIGANGAGKSTLCRVLSGLLAPDVGEVVVRGEVSALLSLGTGFNAALSGRENVYLNGMMLGLSRKEMAYLFPGIIEFSGLGNFIDQPLKTYSSGMVARLGFSIAAMVEPEILILDETLSAGDIEFKERAAAKMGELVGKARMVIVVTHDTGFVSDSCNRALWLDRGTVRDYGEPEDVVSHYIESIPETATKRKIVDFSETRPRSGTSSEVVNVAGLGIRYPRVKKREPFWALKNVGFKVNEGEIVGVIGRNGAGKTTLCRVLTSILKPDEGSVLVKGRTTALLSFGAGFNIQLSGRDNVYLNGMMLGISKKWLGKLYGDIVEFSGLEREMSKPMKYYSSGMKARLGFSVAAMIKPDVFIIDEALGAGDLAFAEKASAKIQELITEAKAVIVVTHSLDFVEKVCTRALWLDQGVVQVDGDPEEATESYRQALKRKRGGALGSPKRGG